MNDFIKEIKTPWISSGLVSAVAPGQAVITAYSTNGGYIATSTVTVTGIPVTGVTVSPSVLNLAPTGRGSSRKQSRHQMLQTKMLPGYPITPQ